MSRIDDANGDETKNEEGGLPEPKSPEEWSGRGASGGKSGEGLSIPGGSSQGTGDRSRTSKGDDKDVDQPVGRPPQPKPGEG